MAPSRSQKPSRGGSTVTTFCVTDDSCYGHEAQRSQGHLLCADRSGKALQGAGISVLKVMGAQQGRRRLQVFCLLPHGQSGEIEGFGSGLCPQVFVRGVSMHFYGTN